MAVEYFDGFQSYNTSQIGRVYSSNAFMAINSAGGGPDGTGQYLQTAGGGGSFIDAPLTVRSEYYLGFDYNGQQSGQPICDIFTAATALICSISAGGSVNTTFGNSSSVMGSTSTWYQIVIYLKRHATLGILTVRVDGVTVINLTGINTGATDIGKIRLGLPSGGATPAPKFANFWVFNTLGTHSNGFPTGRMAVQTKMPSGDGTYSGLTPDSGAVHYTRVDEAQADDDTTYNASLTAGAKDTYTVPSVGGSISQIHAGNVLAVLRKDDVDPKVARVLCLSGATLAESANIGVPLTYVQGRLLLVDDPNTTAQWTAANADAVEIGGKVVS